MRRIAFAIVFLFVAGAGADALQEWKTPAGKIYFGDRPPAGSVAVKKVEKPIGRIEVPDAAPVPRAEPLRTEWREDAACHDLAFGELSEEPFQGIARRTIRGTVLHDGKHVVRDVKVCAAQICEELRGGESMVNGEREDFELDIVDVANTVAMPVRIECSVHAPA